MNQLSIVLLLLLVLSVGFGGYKWSDLSQKAEDAEELAPVSYTHLTLPTIYSV